VKVDNLADASGAIVLNVERADGLHLTEPDVANLVAAPDVEAEGSTGNGVGLHDRPDMIEKLADENHDRSSSGST
jgi:hypothetical protein